MPQHPCIDRSTNPPPLPHHVAALVRIDAPCSEYKTTSRKVGTSSVRNRIGSAELPEGAFDRERCAARLWQSSPSS
eukprot:15290951-Alexandrium_andersonii.AAC.1